MAESQKTVYNNESWMRPGTNGQFLVWLVLIGVPVLLLMLINMKEAERPATPPADTPAAMQHH